MADGPAEDARRAQQPCWAANISPCGSKLTREHFFTRGIFLSEMVEVFGGPFGAQPRRLSIDDLTTKSLCERHNNELSPLDDAVIDTVNALRELRAVREIRERRQWKAPGPNPYRLSVSGVLLERWACKLILSLERVFRSQLPNWSLPAWLPEVPFAKRALPAGAGLAFLGGLNDAVRLDEHIKVRLGQRPADRGPSSAIISLTGGLTMFFSWEQPVSQIGAVNVEDDNSSYWGPEDLLFHLQRLQFADLHHKPLNLSLDLNWTDPPPPRDRELVRLARKYRPPDR